HGHFWHFPDSKGPVPLRSPRRADRCNQPDCCRPAFGRRSPARSGDPRPGRPRHGKHRPARPPGRSRGKYPCLQRRVPRHRHSRLPDACVGHFDRASDPLAAGGISDGSPRPEIGRGERFTGPKAGTIDMKPAEIIDDPRADAPNLAKAVNRENAPAGKPAAAPHPAPETIEAPVAPPARWNPPARTAAVRLSAAALVIIAIAAILYAWQLPPFKGHYEET